MPPTPKTQTKALSLSNTEKLILMSDMHRGNGTSSDDFAHNSLMYKCALSYYLENGFTYIELGDAEEMWENRTFDQIYITHSSIYEQLAQFHDPDPQKTRYIKIWGNHDLEWRDNTLTEKKLLDSKIGTPDIEQKIPDPSYYNTGSCVHPRCITGIEITFSQEQKPEFTLIKWAQSAQSGITRNAALSSGEYNLSIRRTVLEHS